MLCSKDLPTTIQGKFRAKNVFTLQNDQENKNNEKIKMIRQKTLFDT